MCMHFAVLSLFSYTITKLRTQMCTVSPQKGELPCLTIKLPKLQLTTRLYTQNGRLGTLLNIHIHHPKRRTPTKLHRYTYSARKPLTSLRVHVGCTLLIRPWNRSKSALQSYKMFSKRDCVQLQATGKNVPKDVGKLPYNTIHASCIHLYMYYRDTLV